MLPGNLQPMPLVRRPQPFSHRDGIHEIKLGWLPHPSANRERPLSADLTALASLPGGSGPEHPLTLKVACGLGESYAQRTFKQAESLLGKVLEARRRILGSDNPYTAEALGAGRDQARRARLCRRGKTAARGPANSRAESPDAWERYWTESMLGASLRGLGKHSEVRPLLISAYRGCWSCRDRFGRSICRI